MTVSHLQITFQTESFFITFTTLSAIAANVTTTLRYNTAHPDHAYWGALTAITIVTSIAILALPRARTKNRAIAPDFYADDGIAPQRVIAHSIGAPQRHTQRGNNTRNRPHPPPQQQPEVGDIGD